MQVSALNETINQMLEETLAVLSTVDAAPEQEKLAALSHISVVLQENVAALKKNLTDCPPSQLSYGFYDETNDILQVLFQWRANAKIRSLVHQTPLPPQLRALISVLRDVLQRLSETAELVAEPSVTDSRTQQFCAAVMAWDIADLPRDAATFKAAQDYYEVLQQTENQARLTLQATISACEKMLATMQQAYQQKPGIVDTAAQEQLLQQTLTMCAQNAASTFATYAATAARVTIDELVEEILATTASKQAL